MQCFTGTLPPEITKHLADCATANDDVQFESLDTLCNQNTISQEQKDEIERLIAEHQHGSGENVKMIFTRQPVPAGGGGGSGAAASAAAAAGAANLGSSDDDENWHWDKKFQKEHPNQFRSQVAGAVIIGILGWDSSSYLHVCVAAHDDGMEASDHSDLSSKLIYMPILAIITRFTQTSRTWLHPY